MTKPIQCIAALSLFCLSSMSAATLQKESLKVAFTGYKTTDMVGVNGSFTQIQYKFGKDQKSLKGLLTNASASVTPNSVVIDDNDEATQNMITAFFSVLIPKGAIQVVFQNIQEGNNKGVIDAKVTIGTQSSVIPLTYTITNNKFEAKGQLNLHNFSNGAKALKSLSDKAAGHGGITWQIVDIKVSADMQ